MCHKYQLQRVKHSTASGLEKSTLRFFLQQKGETVEIKELTAVVNLKQTNKKQQKKRKGKRGKSC